MSLKQSPTSTIERPGARNESETRLHGRGLLIARAGWVVLALLVLTLNAIAIPQADALLQAACQPGTLCISSLTPANLHQLRQLGLSPGFLAAYQVGWDVGSTLIYTALAALIFWRRSLDRMALFCAYMLVLFGGATFTGLLDVGLRTVAPTWFWLVGGLELVAQVSVPTFFLLFPSGRFVPRWTQWSVLVFVLYEVWYVFFASQDFGQGSPLGALTFAALILSLVGLQVYRYRRVSTFRERQQTKWVVFGLVVALGGFALFIIGSLLLPPELLNSSGAGILLSIAVPDILLLFIPISIAIAILRSRLYDIDTIINKALVYGLLTGILGVLYAGLIIGLESLVGLISGQHTQPPVIVVSTLIIYALFQPIRARIQRIIDRRFYRRKYNAARTLAAFSATLRHEVDLSTLSKHLVEIVQETMQPSHLSLWLRSPERQRTHWSPGRANPSVPSESETRDQR